MLRVLCEWGLNEGSGIDLRGLDAEKRPCCFAGTVAFGLYTMYFLVSDVDMPMKLTFSVYLGSAIFGMGCSTVFHVLACHSPDVCLFFNKCVSRIYLSVSVRPPNQVTVTKRKLALTTVESSPSVKLNVLLHAKVDSFAAAKQPLVEKWRSRGTG